MRAIRAPFTLPGTDGNFAHRLSDYAGRWVVLAFFPKAYTGGCTIECKALRDASQELGAFDVAYFMASTDNLEDNQGFAAQNNANFPLLSDASKTVADAYGVLRDNGLARRWTFYIDPKGIIQRVDRAVDPASAGATLVKNLRSLGAPEASSALPGRRRATGRRRAEPLLKGPAKRRRIGVPSRSLI